MSTPQNPIPVRGVCQLSSFTAARPAQPAQAMPSAAKALPTVSAEDPYVGRLLRSRAQTQKGLTRLSNSILREAIGRPLTRAQRAEIRKQTPKLERREIDKNSYRAPLARQRSPKEMKNRRKPEWATCNFCLPRKTLEGLRLLAKAMAERERQARIFAELGHRRRYPKTRNYYVVAALNALFAEYGMAEFCVEEDSPVLGRVRRERDEELDAPRLAKGGRPSLLEQAQEAENNHSTFRDLERLKQLIARFLPLALLEIDPQNIDAAQVECSLKAANLVIRSIAEKARLLGLGEPERERNFARKNVSGWLENNLPAITKLLASTGNGAQFKEK